MTAIPVKNLSFSFTIGNTGSGEKNLKLYNLKENFIDTNNGYVEIIASGEFAANGNSKTVKFYFGNTLLFNSGALSANGGTWTINAKVIRTNVTSQTAEATITINGETSAVTATTPTQNLANEVTLKCTGEGTANNDIVQKSLVVKYFKV